MVFRSFRGFGKVFSCLKSKRAALNYGKSSKQVTLTVLVLLLTFSIVLVVSDTNTTKTHTQLSFSSKTADSKGELLWDKTFGGTSWDEGYCVVQTSDGGYIITGHTFSYGIGGFSDVWLIKTNANGDEEWNQTFGGTGVDYGRCVVQTADGGYIITGDLWSYGNPGVTDVWLIKTDSNGDMMWNQTYGGTRTDKGNSVMQTSDGGYIIVGATWSFGAGWSDVWLIKDSRFKNLEDTRDNDGESILSNNNVAIFIAIGVSITISALFGKYLSRKIKHRQEKPKEKGEWEGVFFKYK